MSKLTHFNQAGEAHMVDVGDKPVTHRVAVATGRIRMSPLTLDLVRAGTTKKGDVLGVARIAAIQAAKRTSELIPLCHPLPLTRVAVEFSLDEAASSIECVARVETRGQTGVEMEALTGASVAALTVYDMCKALSHEIVIAETRLVEKTGGKSDFRAAERTR